MPLGFIDPPTPFSPTAEWERFEREFLASIEALPEGERAVAREQLRQCMKGRLDGEFSPEGRSPS